MKVDAANDLALLKAEGRFAALPVVASRAMRLGNTVATVGFPNVGLQGGVPRAARHGGSQREPLHLVRGEKSPRCPARGMMRGSFNPNSEVER